MADTHCPCAQVPARDSNAPLLGMSNDCFELRVVHRLVSFTVAGEFVVPAATLIATLPPAHVVGPPSNVASIRADQPIRAGPFSPTALRARLMVFLT